MTDFDLVPREYRLERALARWLRQVLSIAVGIVVVTGAGGTALALANGNLDAQIRELQTHSALTAQQRAQLETLDARIAELGQQWQLLNALRSGAPAEQIFLIIDAALDDNEVWFRDWQFARAGTAAAEPKTVNSGYFIIVDDPQTEPAAPWRVETHLRINGQARDHAALSRFLRALFERTEVRDVRVQRTALRRFTTANVVEFEIAVLLSDVEGSS